MHECLEVFDIIKLILEAVRDDPSRVASQTLISLAVTCRAFHDVALDTLWFKQTSLVPLLKVLPRRFWKETPNVGFYRKFVSVSSLFVEVLTRSFSDMVDSCVQKAGFYQIRFLRTADPIP